MDGLTGYSVFSAGSFTICGGNILDRTVVLTSAVTIFMGIMGFIAAYVQTVQTSQRRERLEWVNRQIAELYGPLLALMCASTATWEAFRKKYRPGKAFFEMNDPPTEEEKEIWRTWMSKVFMPINEKAYNLIILKGDLIATDDLPQCMLDLCAHVLAYRVTLARWEEHDFSEHLSLLRYPTHMAEHCKSIYGQLKREQTKLTGNKRTPQIGFPQ